VLPVALRRRIHHQKVAIRQVDGEGVLAITERIPGPGPEAQGSGHAEAEGGDRGLIVEFGFVVSVPAHAIGAAAVAVEQEAVEAHPQLLLQPIAQLAQRGRPGRHALNQAAVAVGAARIRHPAGESRRGVAPAVNGHLGLLPGQRCAKVTAQGLGVDAVLLQPAGLMPQEQAGPFQADQGNARDTP